MLGFFKGCSRKGDSDEELSTFPIVEKELEDMFVRLLNNVSKRRCKRQRTNIKKIMKMI